METKIIIAGFGGQGILFAGTLLCQMAIEENKHTTWLPSYGPEMRGGTANSNVIISDEEIGSPMVSEPDVLVAMNEMSFDKFMPHVAKDGLILFNSSLIKEKILPNNIKAVGIKATEIADKELADIRVANLVLLGTLIKETKILKLESAIKACIHMLADKKGLVNINQKALEIG
jgi:2-oxoglutarate ferredoxin oxidoreductase subunit gamma